ncbi:ribonuclease H-like YkuK family protein [Tuberibacillus sp. Marseille-P3662]|uniref:ribonuclease H-like YkuK family protein n=1 Tax=Tuberibacillus sp. Marseille-P3662 TaxID=1965358 RepID=UPI000A1CC4C3|nr:ribonuclease H-like YkuK family protein [Tuberibacillus sp. Marseille-P3662]
MLFTSPTTGQMTIDEVMAQIKAFINEAPNDPYRIVVGTDSQTSSRSTCFVTALIVHRVGKGARFYFRKFNQKPVHQLSYRIYKETEFSLMTVEYFKNKGVFTQLSEWPVEIHLDIGNHGKTRTLIKEIVGWVTAVGYTPKIKPDSFGASSVADKFTKKTS